MKLLSSRGRASEAEISEVDSDAKPYDFKVAVIVNGKTASAAEIVAGALQDNDRAAIVGEPTYGKGLVQRVYPLSDDTGLALTISFYYTPSGRSLQRPLHGNELAEATRTIVRPSFKTVGGRTVLGGGGIEPDVLVQPDIPGRFGVYLEASGSYTAFATEWLAGHKSEASRDLTITPGMLDEFQSFLSHRGAQPTVSEWTAERERMVYRLKQEILNQSVGVEAGDEVELRHDPMVRRAVETLGVQ
jgi:carboxyl-terminal processing protease